MKQKLIIIIMTILCLLLFSSCGSDTYDRAATTEPENTQVTVQSFNNWMVGGSKTDSKSESTISTDKDTTDYTDITSYTPENSTIETTVSDVTNIADIPNGEYFSEVGDYSITFLNYSANSNGGYIEFAGSTDDGEPFKHKIEYVIGEKENGYRILRLHTQLFGGVDFVYYYEMDILQSLDSISGSDYHDYESGMIPENISGYMNGDRCQYLRFFKEDASIDVQTVIPTPDLSRNVFYIEKEYVSGFGEIPKRYIYEDEAELVEVRDYNDRIKICTYRVKTGDYIELSSIEYKMIDYVNMTGLNNLWALNFGKGISYGELKEEYPLITVYCDFYLSDEQKEVSSKSFVIDDVEISFSVATWDCDKSAGEGLYINGYLVEDEFEDSLGEPTYTYYRAEVEISYVNGEYVTTYANPYIAYYEWHGEGFSISEDGRSYRSYVYTPIS